MAKIKRSLVATFLNIGSVAVPDWALIGPGVTSALINYNPKTTEETYIHEDSANISVDSYAPTMPVEASAILGDEVFVYVDNIRKGRLVLAQAETEVVNVWLYETPVAGLYPAEKQSVSLQVDTFGGEGGTANKINFAINYLGDPVLGTFDPVAKAFVATP